MRINEIKTKVYQRCGVNSTSQLKKQFNHLTEGKDLRYKISWQAILKALDDDYTLADLDRDTHRMKQSLHRIGRALGHSYKDVEDNWDRMNDKPIEKSYAAAEREYLASLEVE